MQKVITITQLTVGVTTTSKVFLETEYPQLTKYLEEGYIIRQTIHTELTTSTAYAITFILEK
ncbi:hypothetical protein IVB69_09965 [Flavobacterium sp. J49]|uniref:hypothetical protein n=1 Tax=Flavobacterium sp. J49 TaxID=2718534 RepID=UPI001592B954|nr:hypothetical protein [Flavobacterium sp. J49]MBF6641803.1 hypothetical protein [Flavobacterium sp. J49]NIC03050.1 hypothetical protein [Flavobacterium sp. J49]